MILLLSCMQAAQAEKVSREQAEERAAAFFRSARHAGISPASVPSLRMVRCSSSVPAGLQSEDAAFYVFNNTSGPGTPVKVLETAVQQTLSGGERSSQPDWLHGYGAGHSHALPQVACERYGNSARLYYCELRGMGG